MSPSHCHVGIVPSNSPQSSVFTIYSEVAFLVLHIIPLVALTLLPAALLDSAAFLLPCLTQPLEGEFSLSLHTALQASHCPGLGLPIRAGLEESNVGSWEKTVFIKNRYTESAYETVGVGRMRSSRDGGRMRMWRMGGVISGVFL